MSNDIYPTLPGLTFNVVRSIVAPPVTIKITPSQREYRIRDSVLPRYVYTLPYEFLRSRAAFPELQTLAGFYNIHGGSYDNFLFLDPDDYVATTQGFGTGNGSTRTFTLLRVYGGFSEIVDALIGTPTVFDNGSTVSPSAYTINTFTGTITFTTAPVTGHLLTWTGQFYHRVRFDMDTFDTSKFMKDFWENKKVTLRSTRT